MRLNNAMRLLCAAACLAAFAASESRVSAQMAAAASLRGTVLDQTFAVVRNAAIVLRHKGTGAIRQLTTDDEGRFSALQLAAGIYVLTVNAAGFAEYRLDVLELNVTDERALRIVLHVENLEARAEVEARATLARDAAAVATTVPQELVERLPLNGRTLQSLLLLTPGVTLSPTNTQGGYGQFSVNGQRPNANVLLIDGASANVGVTASQVPGEGGSGALPALTVQGSTSNLVSIDALQEFTVQTSTYSAEFGRAPGGQISMVTRSGTNTFHGTAFEYFRDDRFDAPDYFVVRNGLAKPPLSQHQFGGTLGGPVYLGRVYDGRNRTHFFISQENLRLQQPQVANTLTVGRSARAAAPATARAILDAYPLPTGPDGANGLAPFAASYSVPSRNRATSLRLDQTFHRSLTGFVRANHAPSFAEERVANMPSMVRTTSVDTDYVTAGATWVAGSTRVVGFRYNASRSDAFGTQALDDFGGAIPPSTEQLLPAAAGGAGFFNVNIIGLTGFGVGTDARNVQRQHQWAVNVTEVRGRHSLKAGFDYRRLRATLGSNLASQYRATYNFGSVAAVSAGQLTTGIINVRQTATLAFTNVAIYAQDDWRPTPRLTLSYGVRFDRNPAPRGATDADQPWTVASIDDLSAVTVDASGRNLFETPARFAPRVGFAYRVSESSGRETTVRGGYGLYYDLGYGAVLNAAGAYPLLRTRRLPAGTAFPLTDITAAPLPVDAPPPYDLIRAFDPNLTLPRTAQFSVSIDQQLGPVGITASYVGADGRDLLRQESISRPSPTIALLQLTTNGDRSSYDALQLQTNVRAVRGLTALVSYTLARAKDTSSTDAATLPPSALFAAEGDFGPADHDVRHALSAAVSWTPNVSTDGWRSVLADWTLDGILHARSATPLNVTGFLSAANFAAVRPDVVPGVPFYLDDPAAPGGRRLNAAAFSFGSAVRQGTLGRNALRGFPFWQVDFAVGRRVPLAGPVAVELRVEAFNVFNRANLANAPGSLGTVAASGQIAPNQAFGISAASLRNAYPGLNALYQIGGPRSMQLAARLRF